MVVLCLTNRFWSTLNPLSAIIDISTAKTGASMSIQSINSEIIAGNFSNEQLSSIIDAVKYARAQLTKRNKQALSIRSNVEFTSNKTGRVMRGFVQKIAIKYVTVDTGAGLWRVPASMLKVVE
jgi:hypothetical protein